MALVLTRCKFLATYDPVNDSFIVGDAYEGAVGLSTALLNAGVTDLAGAEAYFTVQYRDRSPTQEPSKRAAFEVGIFKRLSNGRLKRVGSLETSSNGNAPVSWSDEVRELVMQSSLAGSFINQLSLALPVYQRGVFNAATDYSVSSTSKQRLSDDFIITPSAPNSRISATLTGYLAIRSTVNGGDDIRCRVIVEQNDNGVWQEVSGTSHVYGDVNSDRSGKGVIYFSPCIVFDANQQKLNGSGDWQFRLVGEVDYVGNQLDSFFSRWSYEEYGA